MDFRKLKGALRSVLSLPQKPAAMVPSGLAPEGMRIYAIGDIHGRADLLQRMFSAIVADTSGFDGRIAVILLGDLVDRGMESREVIELALAPNLPRDFAYTVLRGNHERMLLDFAETGKGGEAWLAMGGAATLASYGCTPPVGLPSRRILAQLRENLMQRQPERHRIFLRNLPATVSYGDYLFVHAGINPKRSLDEQQEADLIWIRKPFLQHPGPFEKIIVHGHNITMAPELLPHRIGIDTGAYANGVLSAIILEADERRILQVTADAST